MDMLVLWWQIYKMFMTLLIFSTQIFFLLFTFCLIIAQRCEAVGFAHCKIHLLLCLTDMLEKVSL